MVSKQYLEKLTRPELSEYCRKHGIKGYSGKTKADRIKLILKFHKSGKVDKKYVRTTNVKSKLRKVDRPIFINESLKTFEGVIYTAEELVKIYSKKRGLNSGYFFLDFTYNYEYVYTPEGKESVAYHGGNKIMISPYVFVIIAKKNPKDAMTFLKFTIAHEVGHHRNPNEAEANKRAKIYSGVSSRVAYNIWRKYIKELDKKIKRTQF